MAEHLYVRTVNRIEYGGGVFSSSDMVRQEIRNILSDFSDDIYESDDESTMEIPKEDFREGIACFKKTDEASFVKQYPRLAAAGYTVASVTAALEKFLKDADPQQDVVTLDWF